MTEETSDPRRESRIPFAKRMEEFEEQRRWYSTKASLFKTRAQQLDLMIIAGGALVAALPILKTGGDPH
ncbi:MAG: hypothetical protein AAF713_20005 [Pseudomonadota bacterium]